MWGIVFQVYWFHAYRLSIMTVNFFSVSWGFFGVCFRELLCESHSFRGSRLSLLFINTGSPVLRHIWLQDGDGKDCICFILPPTPVRFNMEIVLDNYQSIIHILLFASQTCLYSEFCSLSIPFNHCSIVLCNMQVQLKAMYILFWSDNCFSTCFNTHSINIPAFLSFICLVLHIFYSSNLCNKLTICISQLVPAVSELIVAELMYLQWMDPKEPIYLYINSTGTTRDDGETVSFMLIYIIWHIWNVVFNFLLQWIRHCVYHTG